jgi:hypothetical protein
MASKQGIVAQISTYPGDLRHFQELLPHHIRVWGPSVERIVVTIDTHQASSGRYRAGNYEENLQKLRQLVTEARRVYPALESVDVDYSEAARREVAEYFFDRKMIPAKAWDGGYFHSFFFGLHATRAQYIIHFDGDMLFGGGSKSWISEAIATLDQQPDGLMIAPFPGPPRSDGKVFGHEAEAGGGPSDESAALRFAYRRGYLSSRAFFTDLNKFKSKLGAFTWVRASAKQRFKSRLLGHEPEVIEAEALISKTLHNKGYYRIDMLGKRPGMWSLHPPYRSAEFYRRLPDFIRSVENDDVPDAQRGHYDLNDSMIDWTEARAANRWHRRYLRMLRQRVTSLGFS